MNSSLKETILNGLRIPTMKIVTTFYRRLLVLSQAIDDSLPHSQTRLPVTVILLTEKDLSAYSKFRPQESLNLIEARLSQGDQCFAAWHEGRIVHGAWLSTGRAYIRYLRCTLILSSGEGYVYNTYTQPGYRRRGLAVTVGTHMMEYCRRQRYGRILAFVASENRAGLGLFRKLGFRLVGQYSCVRLGPWQRDWQRLEGREFLPPLSKIAMGQRTPS